VSKQLAQGCYSMEYVLEFDSLHMTQCAKIIVGFMASVSNVFTKRLQTFFFKLFSHVFYTSLTFFF